MFGISQWLQAVLLLLIGVAVGSFGNVVIVRLPKGESVRGRSQCPQCRKILAPKELIPLVSFCMLRGKCAQCKTKISWQYPIVELAGGLLFLAARFVEPRTLFSALLLGLCLWLLLLIAILDAKTERISDALSIPLLLLAILFRFVAGDVEFLGLAVGIGFVGLQWIVSRGRWVGSGDVILIAGISLLLQGWQHVVLCLFLAYMLGASVAMPLLMTGKKKRRDHLAFAPFLVTACAITIFFGDAILRFYLHI
ncbi:MAG: prepilin peptidase [Candidatus Peribacteraceae bacterium]|nr:prepilin peptidase [Candidatus Peribacteraceae bacterium]